MNSTTIVSLATVGIMEILKKLIPSIPTKVKTAISVVLSIGLSVGYGLLYKQDLNEIATLSAASIGMVQVSYNFLLKTLKNYKEKLNLENLFAGEQLFKDDENGQQS